jgi:membrane protease YdiL (CAAX protease family)
MKGRSIAEGILVFSVLQIILLFPEGVRDLVRWESRALGGSYFTGALMIVLGVIVIIAHRYEFNEMGVTGERWRRSVNYGFRGWMFFIIPQYMLSFILAWGVSYRDSVELAGFLGVLILLACFLMATRKEMLPASNRRLVIIGLIMVSPLILMLLASEITLGILKTYVWNILIGGFAEEFFYRGYLQSSINLEYGTNWRLGKIKFGPGLLVSSLLYGLSRGLRTIKPWSGVYSISWGWTLYAFTLGIFYGLIRESSGDIIGSGTANSMIDAIGEALLNL